MPQPQMKQTIGLVKSKPPAKKPMTPSIENAVGTFPVPLGIARNFVIGSLKREIVMATEERTVIAAASKAAKLCLPMGFVATASARMTAKAQVLFSGLSNPAAVANAIENDWLPLTTALKEMNEPMKKYGGGSHSFTPRLVKSKARGVMLVVDLEADVGDAMGANFITKIAERLAELLIPYTGRRRTGAICTNSHLSRWSESMARWPIAALGEDLVERILDLQEWARRDPLRAVTHNKGVMNGITAVCLATGQDTRAVEAAIAAWAYRSGTCQPLTTYERLKIGMLQGSIELPLPIGTAGGATGHPSAQRALRRMGVRRTEDLARIIASVGLAQNFGALRALADEGIPESHRRLDD